MPNPSVKRAPTSSIEKVDPRDLEIGAFKLKATGVEIAGKPSLDEWRGAMQFINRAASGVMWWHGDMLNFGYATYGELASQEDGDGKYEGQTLYDAKWVADRIPISVRTEKLSFTHHKLVAPLDQAEQKKWLKRAEAEELPVADLRRLIRGERLRAEQAKHPLPPNKYRVIYADPPWKYADELIEGYGAAEHHYPTLSIEELCEFRDASGKAVAELALDDAVLFMWATSPLLDDAFKVIEAWGFTYKTSFVWDKVKHNYGHYNSVRHELLLVSTRGSCTPDNDTLHDSVVECERDDKHSRKPEVFYEIIEGMYTTGPRIELFARENRKGWKSWGNEAKAA